MTKTNNYNLKKPEPNDPLRVADFNENADILDAALAGKAEQSTVTALDQSVSALSAALGSGGKNCRIAFGSYTGDGTYGKSNPTTLSPGFCPVFAAVGTDDQVEEEYNPSLLIRGRTLAQSEYGFQSSYDSLLHLSWSDTAVSWYNTSYAAYQNNADGSVYYYVIVGYDK